MTECSRKQKKYLKILKQKDIKIQRLERLVKLLKKRILTDELIIKAENNVEKDVIPPNNEVLCEHENNVVSFS